MKFLRSQLAAIAGSAIDFLTTILFVELFDHWYLVANATGNVAGGIANFFLGRVWVFNSRQNAVNQQFKRYLMVWVGNLVLNTSGVYLLTHHAGIKYIYSKIVISVLLGIFYNYYFQYNFVFKREQKLTVK